MKRLAVFVPFVAMLALAGSSLASPVTVASPQAPEIGGLRNYVTQYEFKGGDRACVIAVGKHKSNVGLYVYDSKGNCVAWDDVGKMATFDDMAVEWYPPQNGIYVVEVHNNGMRSNQCRIFVR
ncbi:MAG TPA: hypothetical protein VE988_17680 [Gemmataceae bacterium]|nr:hypothetical protein [Gemmataceae bacterium]